ncbi:MAG: methionyl-tRNA formyltransferase [Pseudomonadales bacterium]
MNIVFAGTPEFAAHNLAAILDAGLHVSAVYTQPDRPAGRGRKLRPSATKALAVDNNIEVYQPLNFNEPDSVAQLQALQPDVLIVVAYGIILPQHVLDIPKYGCINVHASLLPRWRGAAPIERARLSGDKQTGITIMQMDKGLDTGDMLNKVSLDINQDMTSADLYQQLLPLGVNALITTLNDISQGTLKPESQDDQLACYAEKLTKEEALIDWSAPAAHVLRKIKGMSPRPVAHSQLGELTIRIWNAEQSSDQSQATAGSIVAINKKSIVISCGDGQCIAVTELQLPGTKRLTSQQVLNAKNHPFQLSATLSSVTH